MKYYEDFSEQKCISGSQPKKTFMQKNFGKGKRLHSFVKDENIADESNKFRTNYKRAENKDFMRRQLRDIQLAF